MPLRFPRPVVPVIAAGMAVAWVVAGSAPAFAGQVRQQEWWLSALNITQAWHTSRGSGVTVAVLSDGVDGAQAGLGSAVTAGPDFTNAAEATSTFVGVAGTEAASLIAGRGTGAGVIGVAPKARILSIRVTLDPADPAMDSATTGAGLPGAIAAGIRYAVAHHAKVIDLPIDPGEPSPSQLAGLPIPPAQPGQARPTKPLQLAGIAAAAGGSAAEQSAVAYARHKGVVLVAPAGNNGSGTDATNYPAAYPGVIAVGAFDQAFTGAPYSGHHSYVALTGPGSDVIAASSAGGATIISSTNAASAVVSGIAALIRSKYPSLTATQVGHILTKSAVYRTSGASAPGQGSGTVDAGRAMTLAASLKAPPDARAGAGAVAFASPATPGIAPVTSNGLAPRILRAAIISVALLVLLLLAALAYRAAGRRRERKEAVAAAEWARSTQNAFSPYGDQEADRMLEFFAAPSTSTASSAAPFSPFPATPGPAAQLGDRDAGTAAAGSVTTAPSRPASSPVGGGVGAWVPLGSAARTHSRQVRVSGAPPWEPAAEPASELPWAAVPGTAAAPGAAAASARSAAAGAAADSIWPSVTTTPAAPSPSGRAWADLATTPAASPDTQSLATTSTSAAPDLDVPAPAADGTGLHTSGFESPSAFPAPGSRLPSRDAGAGNQSPSGSDWELPDGDPDRAEADADARWEPRDSGTFRQPAPAGPEADPGAFAGSAGLAGWLPSADQARWRPDTADDAVSGTSATGSIPRWTPTAADDSWPAAGPSGPWPTAAESDYDSDYDSDYSSGPDRPASGLTGRSGDPTAAGLPSGGLPGHSPASGTPASDSLTADGRATDGRPANGRPADGRPADGRPADGAATDGEISDGGAPDDAPAARPWSTDGTSGIFRWGPTPPAAGASTWTPGHARAAEAPGAPRSAESSQEPAQPGSSWGTPAPDSTWDAPTSGTSWGASDSGSSWGASDSGSSWDTPASDSTWSTPASDSSRGTPAPGSSRGTPAPGSSRGTPAPDWNAPASDSGWESAGTQARRRSIDAQGAASAPDSTDRPDAPNDANDGDANELYAWRPSAQTETFPALDED